MRPQHEEGPAPCQETWPTTPVAFAKPQMRRIARARRDASAVRRSSEFLWLSATFKITIAAGLLAFAVAFAKWLAPRWHLLPETDQVFAVFACAMLALCAIGIVLRLHPRRH